MRSSKCWPMPVLRTPDLLWQFWALHVNDLPSLQRTYKACKIFKGMFLTSESFWQINFMHVGLYKLPQPKLFLQLIRASKSYFYRAENSANMPWRDVEFSRGSSPSKNRSQLLTGYWVAFFFWPGLCFLDLAAPKSHMDDHYLTSRHVQQSQSLLKYTHIIGGILSIVTKISVCSFRLSQIILISWALIVLYYIRRCLRIQLETDLEGGRVSIPRHLYSIIFASTDYRETASHRHANNSNSVVAKRVLKDDNIIRGGYSSNEGHVPTFWHERLFV